MLTLRNNLYASFLSLLSQISRRLVGIASLVVLARVLSPEDFGLVAIALLFLNFVNVVSDIGENGYLMGQEKLTDEMVDTGWTLKFLIKGSLGLILASTSVFVADFYHDERLMPIILALSVTLLIQSIVSPGLIYKKKKQEIGSIVLWGVMSRFVVTGIVITVALVFETYWALILGTLLNAISHFLASYTIAPKRPKFCLSNGMRQWQFSKWIIPQSLINYFRSQIDAIFVSTVFDKSVMGAYNSMRYYATIPGDMLINPALSPMLAQFSEFKQIPTYFANQIQVVLYCIAFLCPPIALTIGVHGEYFVEIILGSKWVEYGSLLSILGNFIFVVAFNKFATQLVFLKEETKLLLGYSISSVLVQVTVFICWDFNGIYELAKVKITLDVIFASMFLFFIIRRYVATGNNIRFFSPILVPVFALAISFYLCSFLLEGDFSSPFLYTATHILTGMGIYLILNTIALFVLKERVYCCGYLYLNIMVFIKKLRK